HDHRRRSRAMIRPTECPQATIDYIVHQRGTPHICESLEAAKTALIVVNMQRAFFAKGAAIKTPDVCVSGSNTQGQSWAAAETRQSDP
ncbi:MAG: hypothetical protein VCB07_11410, partial [Gammaproteobacteria bacterium]